MNWMGGIKNNIKKLGLQGITLHIRQWRLGIYVDNH